MRLCFLLLPVACLFGCTEPATTEASQSVARERAATFTLYRNSDISRELRIHVATFNADDMPGFNQNNCRMTSRLLNANLVASAESVGRPPHESVGFWCEEGSYRERGFVPLEFEAAFPDDV